MNDGNPKDAIGSRIKKRVPIQHPSKDLVSLTPPQDGWTLPAVMRPAAPGVDISGWAALARSEIQTTLLRYGAIVFRGFEVKSEEEFQRFIQSASGDPLPYEEQSSPRTKVQGNIYTSTDHPPDQPIFLHSENSYRTSWPLKIFFYCHVEPECGGETPIADTRRILSRIRPDVRNVFARKGVMYVRNMGAGLGLPWQVVFQTEDQKKVEQYCSSAGIECIWRPDDGLTTRQVRAAIRKHPVTGQDLWFNHAVFFHFSTLPLETQTTLRSVLTDDQIPNNTYWGDGSPFEPEVLDHLRSIYELETVSFPWQKGDILMLDNMLAAHGRSPYKGARKILVGMTEPYSSNPGS